jgi:hypothetical protein
VAAVNKSESVGMEAVVDAAAARELDEGEALTRGGDGRVL